MRPSRISWLIWCVIALLGVLCLVNEQAAWKFIHWPTLSQVLNPQEGETVVAVSDSVVLPASEEKDTSESSESIGSRKSSVSNVSRDSSSAVSAVLPSEPLEAFYNALAHADSQQVRVVHYGDSQIEEDRITSELREGLQQRFGGGGVGLIPLHQTIPTHSIRQRVYIDGVAQSTGGGPKRYLVYGPPRMRRNTDLYGPMGQVALMNDSFVMGSEDLSIHIEPLERVRHTYHYFSRVRLLANHMTGQVRAQSAKTFALLDAGETAVLPDSTTTCDIRLQDQGEVYGISLETPTGVIVDNIPMRGSSGNVFTKIQQEQLTAFYRETNTRLIILQYGGNMIPHTLDSVSVRKYVYTMGKQVEYLQACAPNASFLFIGPSDMLTNIKGNLVTYPMVPYMDALLKQMAKQHHIGYYSLYRSMGGSGSMLTYYRRGWAGGDYIHFTKKGASETGKALWRWIENGIQENERPKGANL